MITVPATVVLAIDGKPIGSSLRELKAAGHKEGTEGVAETQEPDSPGQIRTADLRFRNRCSIHLSYGATAFNSNKLQQKERGQISPFSIKIRQLVSTHCRGGRLRLRHHRGWNNVESLSPIWRSRQLMLPWRNADTTVEVRDGIHFRTLGVYEGAEEILAVSNRCRARFIERIDRPRVRIRCGAVHLHAVLV